MVTTQTNKQTNKHTNTQKKLSSRIDYVTIFIVTEQTIFIVLIKGNEKALMNLAAVSAKTLETVKLLPTILFKIYIINRSLLLCF